jgi:hypothetical protein
MKRQQCMNNKIESLWDNDDECIFFF